MNFLLINYGNLLVCVFNFLIFKYGARCVLLLPDEVRPMCNDETSLRFSLINILRLFYLLKFFLPLILPEEQMNFKLIFIIVIIYNLVSHGADKNWLLFVLLLNLFNRPSQY